MIAIYAMLVFVSIRYTKHAIQKLADLKELGIVITKSRIRRILNEPDHLDTTSYHPNRIASGYLDARHILRVVYHTEDDIITVVTFCPTKAERYYV